MCRVRADDLRESPKESQLWRQKQQNGLEEAAAEKKTRRQSSREPGSFTEGMVGNTQILAGLPNRNRLFPVLLTGIKQSLN